MGGILVQISFLVNISNKGRDAFSEYGEGEYWSGVGEAALVGGLTSAVYGGTLGKIKALGGQSAIERDAGNVFEDIEQLERTRG